MGFEGFQASTITSFVSLYHSKERNLRIPLESWIVPVRESWGLDDLASRFQVMQRGPQQNKVCGSDLRQFRDV